MGEKITLARPYAKASFDFAIKTNTLNAWSQFMNLLKEVTLNSKTLNALEESGESSRVIEFLSNLSEESIREKVKNLIHVVIYHNRLSLLPEICDEFFNLKNLHENSISVDLISAIELSNEDKGDFQSKLEKRFSKKVKLNCQIDSSLLGGIIVRAKDEVLDYSLRGKLKRMNNILQS